MVNDIRPARGQRRDYTGGPIGGRPAPQPQPPALPPKKVKKSRRKRWIFGVLILLILSAGAASGWIFTHRDKSPVPKSVQSAVSFPIYYPDQKKLPNGYTLDTGSFSAGQDNAVIYKIHYGDNKTIAVTVQVKPPSSALQNFYSTRIPLHTTVNTSVGTATVGAIGTQTIVSLPTNGNSWLLITAPGNIDQSQLKQVLQAFKAP